ncbi:unnamed protein product [Trifolium pratense]|uniref:Uncharacterized protein n=1 Tax=Trifolium pratense TaxID=57577 RepID=A0ACB0LD03_TRIPR|nr:unnamed protein product [Trifolium pratense]
MINAFWWGGGNGNSKGIHWLAWERLACPKDKGGLGFRNFEAFNMAMVAKQAWKILQNPDTLVARLIKARGCIPTRRRLLERHVDCDVHCPLCEDEVEDDVHAFFTCASAQTSWQAAGLSSVLGSAACQQGSAVDRVFAVCRNEDYATIGRVAMLLWSIWQNRNDKIWNDNLRSPIQIGRAAFDQWNEWIAVHKLRSNDDQVDPPVSTSRWEKPRIGWLKCNVDAAFFVSAGRTAMGACFRNNSGEFMAGITQWQQLTLSTEEGEAWALLQAMNEAKSRGFESVQFESDSQVLVDAIRTKRRGNSEFLSIVNEIILVMLSCVNFEVKFIRRQVNSVAHNLARAANSWTSFHRFEIIPSCIELLIINEMQVDFPYSANKTEDPRSQDRTDKAERKKNEEKREDEEKDKKDNKKPQDAEIIIISSDSEAEENEDDADYVEFLASYVPEEEQEEEEQEQNPDPIEISSEDAEEKSEISSEFYPSD